MKNYLALAFAAFVGFFKTSEPHGPSIIDEAHELFHDIIDRLEHGAQTCLHKMQRNEEVVREKLAENRTLHAAVTRAGVTAQNLRQLVGRVDPPVDADHA